ncbi:DNA polymerase III subunit delta [Tetragenococcus osmophilus]|uniref:DNA polymerase III subunit delta n=1 Tax=Tetragenococcus osmophilus TaxID=526944 RepID=A0AA37XKV0_9ENTE|nr:DNA polymerase III subunit delta [Tetragenococcus osmophilus]AYW48634.1 DNA polymerase III subunit delta [Tetragenococcus osmophilus]GMA71594.1 DNA polymerase III subunit delta [Tetragenococcus osmophilus]
MNVQNALQAIHDQDFKASYLVLGTEKYLQKQIRQAFIESLQLDVDDLNFAEFDMEEDSVDAVIDEAESMPFFGDYRLVFVENPFILTAEKKTNAPEHDLDRLISYLKDPVTSTILVFFANYEKLDERKKISKQLKKNAEVIDVAPMNEGEVRRFLQQTLDNEAITMSRDAFELFIRLTDANLTKVMGELQKLQLFAAQTKQISKNDVEALVPKSLEDNVFDLTNYVLKGQTKEALELYEDLHIQGEETIKINAILISQIRLYLQTAILLNLGYQQGNITKSLNVHPYRVKLAVQQVRKMDIQTLTRLYDELIENDYKIKSGQRDKEFLFQLFLLQET